MMRHRLFYALGAFVLIASSATASDRYHERPPVVVSPDLNAPWVMQLKKENLSKRSTSQIVHQRPRIVNNNSFNRKVQNRPVRQASLRQAAPGRPQIAEKFLPQIVNYETKHSAGTVIIDTPSRFLYLIMGNGKAKRYGVGVGKPGFEWAGEHAVTRKAEWPSWTPPQEMIKREAKKGNILPAFMEGGPANPMGSRAMYLGSTLYRIHGTNAPWTIGTNTSSGCIRMRNEDVDDLYTRVKVGARVIVI